MAQLTIKPRRVNVTLQVYGDAHIVGMLIKHLKKFEKVAGEVTIVSIKDVPATPEDAVEAMLLTVLSLEPDDKLRAIVEKQLADHRAEQEESHEPEENIG